MKRQPLRVGFDLDGVILYNPIRIFRPFAFYFKSIFFKKNKSKFLIPRNKFHQFIWILLHKTSFNKNEGIEIIAGMVKKKQIDAYLITGRYSFLKEDLQKWILKLKSDISFTAIYHNKNDEQPHIFKEKLIKKLKLDVFVEDNWNIIRHLYSQKKNRKIHAHIYWLSNLFDMGIDYHYKFFSLKDIADELSRLI